MAEQGAKRGKAQPAKAAQTAQTEDAAEVVVDGARYKTAQEGRAHIYVPLSNYDKERQNGGGGPAVEDTPQSVFYNPIQQFNRDLSVLAIKAYGTGLVARRAVAYAKKASAGKKRKRGDELPKTDVATAAATEGATPDTTPDTAGATAPPLRILDALSATGLRALRYAHELPFRVSVTANDLLPAATEAIARNAAMNGLSDTITVTQGDAVAHMYTVAAAEMAANAGGDLDRHAKTTRRSQLYDVIDLDPYGTGAGFFDAAIQAVRHDGGLLCVTCTDAGVWASQGYPEKCFALYGGVPMKGAQSHEAGLRLVLHALSTAAARYGFAVTPLLSLSIDFYCRVFVTVARSPMSVKFLAGRTVTAYNCDAGCGAWTTQPLLKTRVLTNEKSGSEYPKFTFAAGPTADAHCAHCGSKTHVAGPMYGGALHDAAFVQRILDDLPAVDTGVYGTTARIRGMLQTALEELGPESESESTKGAGLDPTPFFFLPTALAKVVHCETPDDASFRGALLGLGYRAARSHCKPGSVKTDAPWSVVWDIVRAWVRQRAPVNKANIRPTTAAYRILRMDVAEDEATKDIADITTNAAGEQQAIVFDAALGRAATRDGGKLVRYQLNPRENWGPMNRAKGK